MMMIKVETFMTEMESLFSIVTIVSNKEKEDGGHKEASSISCAIVETFFYGVPIKLKYS